MTNVPRPAATRRRWILPLLGLALAGGLAAGAYYNWYLWHPMSGVVVTLVGAVLIIVGAIAVLVRSRRVRPIALVLIVAGFGTIIGQNVGPDRPPTRRHETGSLRLVLTSPIAFDASGPASCGSTADASQLVVDPGEFGMARASEEADFHYPYVMIGDMYDYGRAGQRNDHLSVSITVQLARIPADFGSTENGRPGATIHSSDASSVLALAPGHTLEGGSISFSNLAIGEVPDPNRRSDLVGTVSWTCGPVTVFDPAVTPTGEDTLLGDPLPSDGPPPS